MRTGILPNPPRYPGFLPMKRIAMLYCRRWQSVRLAKIHGTKLLGRVLLFGTLFSYVTVAFVSASEVQAYRKPSDADLQWLFEGQSMPSPRPSSVVQVGFAQSNCQPSNCEPCVPVGLPTPPIPPAPKVVRSLPPTGILPTTEGTIMQMAGTRLPPPSNLPKEPDELAMLQREPIIERLPSPSKQHVFDHSKHTTVIPNDRDLSCQDLPYQSNSKRENIFSVPSMIGSNTALAGSKIRTDTSQLTLPIMLLSRPNVTEQFNAKTQNRIWADYQHWNHAVSIDQNNYLQHKAVEQFTFGLETQIFDNTSLELRVPVLGQFENDQASDSSTSMELGNISIFFKQVLKSTPRWTFSAGIGISLPTADDWRIASSRFHNNIHHLVSFLGVQWHPNRKSFGHFVVQSDMPIEKNEFHFGSNRFDIEGQQILRTGLQLGRWIYRNDNRQLPCRLGSFVEINYAIVTDEMPEWGLTYDQISLTAALGMTIIFDHWTCTNSVILPLSSEKHPYNIGFGFALSRQF